MSVEWKHELRLLEDGRCSGEGILCKRQARQAAAASPTTPTSQQRIAAARERAIGLWTTRRSTSRCRLDMAWPEVRTPSTTRTPIAQRKPRSWAIGRQRTAY